MPDNNPVIAVNPQTGAKVQWNGSSWIPLTPPSAFKRFVTQATGVPENTDFSMTGLKQDVSSLGDISTWSDALLKALSSLNPYSGHTEAAEAGINRMKQPGQRIKGVVEYLMSGVPYAGPPAVRSVEQATEGDIAGSAGSAVQAALLSRAAPEFARRVMTGPIRTAGQFITGVGKDVIDQARNKHAEGVSAQMEKYRNELEDIKNKTAEQQSKSNERTAENKQALAQGRDLYRRQVSNVEKINSESASRQQAADAAKQHADAIAVKLPELMDRARTAAKAAYPNISGTVSSADIHSDVQSAVSSKLYGSGKIPTVLSRIMGETQPSIDTSVRALTQNEIRMAGVISKLMKEGNTTAQLRGTLADLGYVPKQAQAILAVAQGSGPSATEVAGKPIDFDRLHGWYSELGDAAFNGSLPGDERAAVLDARSKIGERMRDMARKENKLIPFESAQAGWRAFENTFRNEDPVASGGSPIARALRAKDPITGKLRSDFVHDILTEDKNYRVAQQLLSRYRNLGAPVDVMQLMKENFDASQGPFTKKAEPPWARVSLKPPIDIQQPKLPEEPSPNAFDPITARRRILQGQVPSGITPSFLWRYQLLRSLMRKFTNVPMVQDFLSKNPE